MDYLLQKRSNLEIELVAINHALRWLREHHRKAISKEMATTFGAETRIPPAPEDKTSGLGLGHVEAHGHPGPAPEDKTSGLGLGHVEAHGHPGSSDDRARSRSRAPAADAELNRDARRGDGGGQDGRCDAGRGRGRKTVSVPPFLCRVCWNESRGLCPAGAHTKGVGNVECRKAPGQPVAKGAEAVKSAARDAVERAGRRAAAEDPGQAQAGGAALGQGAGGQPPAEAAGAKGGGGGGPAKARAAGGALDQAPDAKPPAEAAGAKAGDDSDALNESSASDSD